MNYCVYKIQIVMTMHSHLKRGCTLLVMPIDDGSWVVIELVYL